MNDIYFLKQAFLISSETNDPTAKINPNSAVGCVIVKDGEVISKSANILHEKISNSAKIFETLNQNRYHFIEHAERSAIFKATSQNETLRGSSLYCTRFPCSDCARAMIANGITEIFLPSTAMVESIESHWRESQLASEIMLEVANIPIRYIDI